MKFPRNARMFRGQLDAAPFAGVFFLLLIFVVLNASFVFTSGVRINLPEAGRLAATGRPTVVVAVDRGGLFYFQSQVIELEQLQLRLKEAAARAPVELTLVVQADRAVAHDVIVRLSALAQNAGIKDVILATRPAGTAPPIRPSP